MSPSMDLVAALIVIAVGALWWFGEDFWVKGFFADVKDAAERDHTVEEARRMIDAGHTKAVTITETKSGWDHGSAIQVLKNRGSMQ